MYYIFIIYFKYFILYRYTILYIIMVYVHGTCVYVCATSSRKNSFAVALFAVDTFNTIANCFVQLLISRWKGNLFLQFNFKPR